MLERRKPLDLMFPLKGGASKEVGVRKEGMTAVERLRAAVSLTADAVKAVSLTAMEALREGAALIGIVGEQDELIDPFHHLDAPIWARDPPVELLKLAYSYCEELTMRFLGFLLVASFTKPNVAEGEFGAANSLCYNEGVCCDKFLIQSLS